MSNKPEEPHSGKRQEPPRLTATRSAALHPITPHFSQPVRQIVLMLMVLVLVLAGGWFAYSRILPIFMANLWLNGLILAVFTLGVLACFWQVAQLVTSVSWIERFATIRRNAADKGIPATGEGDQAPRLLAPLAALLGARGPVGGAISASSARSILDSVASRIEEIRDITKYLANLLIFLGLLGTFYGLATTVPAVIDTIRALAPQDGETGVQVFDKLMSGLEAQLGGMATAFSSSLLGLAGSLVVGLLELFVTHGQNRFYRELEEWLSGFTRLSLGSDDGPDIADYSGALDQIAAQMDALQRFYTERDVLRDDLAMAADERVLAVAEAVDALVKRDTTGSDSSALKNVLERLAEGQGTLITLARQQTEQPRSDVNTTHIDAALNRLADQLTDGRDEMIAELRLDLLVLTRAVRAARFSDPFNDDALPDPSVYIKRDE